jgi:hypothetical protein
LQWFVLLDRSGCINMGRYLTNRYVALSWAEATRLAALDQTPLGAIRYSATAELVHRTDWWAWWSDSLLTTAIGLPESCNPQGLSPAAEELITDVWASDSPGPQCGWALLAQVERVLQVETLATPPSAFIYLTIREQLLVELRDGQPSTLYRVWMGADEGYFCQVSTRRPDQGME